MVLCSFNTGGSLIIDTQMMVVCGDYKRIYPKGLLQIPHSCLIMKKMIIDSIRQLKRDKEHKQTHLQSPTKTQQKMNKSPKRQRTDLPHRQKGLKAQGSLFRGFTFCFPIVDVELTPKQIDLLSASIVQEGGRVAKFIGKAVEGHIDFVAINPKVPVENVLPKIYGKLGFKEIINYHFVTDCLKAKRLLNFEKYSLYINVQELQFQAKEEAQHRPSKKQKMDEVKHDEEQEDSDITVKLSDDQNMQNPSKKQTTHKPKAQSSFHHPEKVDIEQLMMRQKLKTNTFSINGFIAEQLTKLMKIYATERDIGRKLAYMKAASVIRALDYEIQSEKDVESLRGIGDKIAKKIKELLTTGKINKLEALQGDEKNIARGKLSEVWGVGPSKANQLYGMGIKTIEDLRKHTDLLNRNQKIGLKYFEEFQQKIPRQKVGKMFEFVRNVIQTMVPSLDLYRIQVCGSYRRGKRECGDIDIIVSRKDGTFEKDFINRLIKELQAVAFLTDHLTHPKPGDDRSSMSYMGVCRFEGPEHHRIDIKYYPIEEFAYAILHFTGSSAFNRILRLHTMRLGLQLSDKGAVPKEEKGVVWDQPIPTCLTEQDIFAFLGLDYKPPLERDI